MEKSFSDERGNSRVIIEGDNAPLNLNPYCNYVLGNRPQNTKSKIKAHDIGIKSNGFAAVASLATIIAVAGVIVAYLTLRY